LLRKYINNKSLNPHLRARNTLRYLPSPTSHLELLPIDRTSADHVSCWW